MVKIYSRRKHSSLIVNKMSDVIKHDDWTIMELLEAKGQWKVRYNDAITE